MSVDFKTIAQKLQDAGVKPTRKRCSLATLLHDIGDRHLTVEQVMKLVHENDVLISLASVYNYLNQFAEAGLVRKISLGAGPVFYDTNISNHYHIYDEDKGQISDIEPDSIKISGLDKLTIQKNVTAIDITIRVRGGRL